MDDEKLRQSLADLKLALDAYRQQRRGAISAKRLSYLSLAKAFEVSLEYAWKNLKRRTVDEGLDPQSPKGAIRDAVRMGLIDNAEMWFEFIEARNCSVHDYFGIAEKDYVGIAEEFLARAEALVAQK